MLSCLPTSVRRLPNQTLTTTTALRQEEINVLALNCGSSSVKCKVLHPITGEVSISCIADRLNTERPRLKITTLSGRKRKDEGRRDLLFLGEEEAPAAAVCRIVKEHLEEEAELTIFAVAPRVVHGGRHFDGPALLDEAVVQRIREAAGTFAPLHNAASLAGVAAAGAAFPGTPQVAVFDTAFHSGMPEVAARYALPEELTRRLGIRRYGFHGSSHSHAYAEATARIGVGAGGGSPRLATAHLGNGCSVAAVAQGRSLDTTMGLTPLEGLMMGTRAGEVDPTFFKVMQDEMGWSVERSLHCLNKESGFLGVAGTADSIEIERGCMEGCERSRLALEMFCYGVAKAVASYVVPLEGLDGLVFTGGIGEKSVMKRERIVRLLSPIGLQLDRVRNDMHGEESEGFISPEGSQKVVLVVKADEELVIAREALKVVQRINKA